MICSRFRSLLLEASPEEIAGALRGWEDVREEAAIAAFAVHIAECVECRDAAERIMVARDALAEALDSATPRQPLDTAVRAALRESERRRSRSRMGAWVLAAAAVAAGVLAVRAADIDRVGGPESPMVASVRPASAALAPTVETLLDESVAVFAIDDPDVVVFWFYQGRGE